MTRMTRWRSCVSCLPGFMGSSWLSTRLRWWVPGGRRLHGLLRLWRLSAVAFSDPGYEGRRQAVEEAVRAGRRGTPVEEVVPDWEQRVAAAGCRRAGG
jgi:hypothetical protein